jgi:Cys-rich protein (TIGR01571 family)
MSQANTPVPVVESPTSENPPASQATTTRPPVNNAPVPVPNSPVLEKPTASQATISAPPVNATPSQAASVAPQAETTASQSSAATPPVLVSDGTVAAPNPTQSLIPTPIPQVSVIPASSNGTASIPREENWRVGLCDADDIETCVRYIPSSPMSFDQVPPLTPSQCAAWCIPCFLSGRIENRLENFPQEDPDYEDLNSTCCIALFLWCCNMGCIPAYMNRNSVRRAFAIQGNDCLDFLVRFPCPVSIPHDKSSLLIVPLQSAFFCTPCTLSQADFELKRRAAEVRAMSPQQYQSGAPQMAYMPPQMAYMPPLQQQRMIQQQPQMQPPNPAYLQVPSHPQPQTTGRVQQNHPVQAADQPQMQTPMQPQSQPRTQPRAQTTPYTFFASRPTLR